MSFGDKKHQKDTLISKSSSKHDKALQMRSTHYEEVLHPNLMRSSANEVKNDDDEEIVLMTCI